MTYIVCSNLQQCFKYNKTADAVGLM